MRKPVPKWKEFELAVAAFLQSMDPTAKVIPDARVPDRHTGGRRQRDILIEGTICKVVPVRILVSCKRYRRVLNELDIDHFHGELLGSHANKGVLCSYSGFNELGVKKAIELGISCMTLYVNAPPAIPEVLAFPYCYFCVPRFHISLAERTDPKGKYPTWQRLLTDTIGPKHEETILDAIYKRLGYHQEVVRQAMLASVFPDAWAEQHEFYDPDDEGTHVSVVFGQFWEIYQALLEAHIVNGCYSFTEKRFSGQIALPAIDILNVNPGPGWTKVADRPKPTGGSLVIAPMFGNIRPHILSFFGDRALA